MGASVTILTGPARCGKTERLLTRYRRVLAERTVGQALWIAPTSRGAAAIRERLLDASLPVCLRPGVVTFDGFAEAVLAAAREPIFPLSAQQQRSLIRHLLRRAASEGRLTHFGPIAEAEGLVDLVVDFIGELKRLEIWPEHFEEACSQRGMTAKDAEFLDLYRRYQEALTTHALYDREGRFWTARRLLREGQQSPFEWLRLVVVDGFSDFTRTQHEILQLLAERVRELHITLPLESSPARADLFAKPQATLDELRRRHAGLKVETASRAASDAWPTLLHIEQHLFRPPQEARRLDRAERIEVVAAARQSGEIELVGRRIKRLLLDGRAGPSEIGVVFRSVADVAHLVREAFGELGIPFALETSRPLGDAPVATALVRFLRLQEEDWPFRRLLAALNNNYLRPDWPEAREGRAVVAAERMVRESQLPRGKNELLQLLAWRAKRAAADPILADPDDAPDTTHDARADAIAAHAFLSRLAAAFDRLPTSATPAAWAQALDALGRDIGLRGVARETSADLRAESDWLAWERLLELMRLADRSRQWLGEEGARLDLSECIRLIADFTRLESWPESRDETGRVRVLSAAAARTLDLPYLFFAGLSERSFPSPEGGRQLYSESELGSLKTAGLPLVDHRERNCEEMLLFYEVLTRASREIVLSYPALDEAVVPHPHSPSSYLLEVERAAGEGVIPRREEVELHSVRRDGEPLGQRELRLMAVDAACDGDVGLLGALLADPSRASVAEPLRASLWAATTRQRGESFGSFEGIVESDAARRLLAQRFGADYPWSPSRLERYAYCPFQFFAQHVLHLESPDDLALEVDYLTRGGLLHDVLAEVHRELNAEAGRPTSPAELPPEEFLARFFRHLDARIEALAPRGLAAALREIDRRLLRDLAEAYYKQHEKYDENFADWEPPMRPSHFEVRFGKPSGSPAPEDPLSRDEPFRLAAGGESFLVAGRIDRIDSGTLAGQPAFNLLDYKSGSSRGHQRKDVEAGQALQLPLYALAARDLLSAQQATLPWQAAYWFVADGGVKPNGVLELAERSGDLIEPATFWRELQSLVAARVTEIVHGLRRGEFPMSCADEKCTGRCEFHTICRVNHVRSLGKTWPAPAGETTP